MEGDGIADPGRVDAVHGLVRGPGPGVPRLRAAAVGARRGSSVEAGVAQPWYRWVGDAGEIVSIEHYGACADYKTLFREFGFTPEHVVAAARTSLDRVTPRSWTTSSDQATPARGAIMTPNERLAALSAAGVSIWLDDLSRERLTAATSGADHRQERRRGHHQPDDLPGRAGERATPTTRRSASWPPAAPSSTTPSARSPSATSATPATCSAARGSATGGVDGRVSLEVSPLLAHDTEATMAEALDLWKTVDRPNLLIKIPATAGGPARDHRRARRGDQRQRHADLLRGALPRT